MPARGAVTLFHVRGIRIGIDYSWFFVLFLIIFMLSDSYGSVLDTPSGDALPYALAVISALALFGGVASMTRDSDSPGTEFKVAVAGPLVTLAIGVACVAIGVAAAGWHEFWRAMLIQGSAHASAVLAVIAWLASINALILFFNLIPAFPLDGGRIARAIAWRITGDRNRATRFAATLGQWFSYGFIGIGIY